MCNYASYLRTRAYLHKILMSNTTETSPFIRSASVNLDWPKENNTNIDNDKLIEAFLLVTLGCNVIDTPITVNYQNNTITAKVSVIKINNLPNITISPEETAKITATVDQNRTKIDLKSDDPSAWSIVWWNDYHATVILVD